MKATKAELEAQLAEQRKLLAARFKELQVVYLALEEEQERVNRVVVEENALLAMLDELFGFKVSVSSFEDGDLFLDIIDARSGRILVLGQKGLAAAYRLAILTRYTPPQQGNGTIH